MKYMETWWLYEQIELRAMILIYIFFPRFISQIATTILRRNKKKRSKVKEVTVEPCQNEKVSLHRWKVKQCLVLECRSYIQKALRINMQFCRKKSQPQKLTRITQIIIITKK